MKWQQIPPLQKTSAIPSKLTLEQLKRQDVPSLIERLRVWFPDIQVGSETCHLQEDFYYQNVFLDSEDETKDIICGVVKNNNEIIAFMTIQRDPDALTVFGRLAAIAPEHRGEKLAYFILAFLESVGRSVGAELVYTFVSLKTKVHQSVPIKQGYRCVGIVPAFDRDMVAPGNIKRVYEAIWAKVLVDTSKVLVPSMDDLTPELQNIWKALFLQ